MGVMEVKLPTTTYIQHKRYYCLYYYYYDDLLRPTTTATPFVRLTHKSCNGNDFPVTTGARLPSR